eukprot:CAMPEP_0184315566 /NCGR_PEP_ID=MMETSP1049-20130417/83447_1 /TAXON_ID=77928 /ORGANISM="Proteomonas sulcata, Strain CCMP704" /LENGTH=156 /DNA_ID=CAMNT_0026634125 /DNA_START=83 /DNA_END=553 /DNA_ORIENTATION=+
MKVEECIQKMQVPGMDTWVWIADFEGFGVKDGMDPRFSIWLIHMFQNHYPERMGCVVCIDAPRLFSVLWSAVKPITSLSTRRKIMFIRGEESRKELADALFEGTTAQWLKENMSFNRRRKEVKASWAQPHPMPPEVDAASKITEIANTAQKVNWQA